MGFGVKGGKNNEEIRDRHQHVPVGRVRGQAYIDVSFYHASRSVQTKQPIISIHTSFSGCERLMEFHFSQEYVC